LSKSIEKRIIVYEDDTEFDELLEINSNLLEHVLDLQEFLLLRGISEESFLKWQETKKERVFH